MFIAFAFIAGAIWLLCRLGNPNLKAWKIRNFLGATSFICGLLGGSMAAAQPSAGASIALGVSGWLASFLVIGLPAAIAYYVIKLRKLPY